MADSVLQMVGTAVASLGTLWVYVGTPKLTGGVAESSIPVGAVPPGMDGFVSVLGYVKWIGFAVAAIAVVLLGAKIAASLRRGQGMFHVGRLGLIAGGVVLISSAGSLVAGLLPAGPRGVGGATLFIQSGLWWVMGAVAVAAVIVGGIRMVWENKADPGFDVIKSLVTLTVVAGAGVTFIQLLLTASDSFSVWLLQQSLQCDVMTDKACFGKNITLLLSLAASPTVSGGLGPMLVIFLGLIVSLASFAQIVLMVLRSAALVILAGVLPVTASATNTEMGKTWFKRCISWITAFLLYKPAAAIVYAGAFQLVGTKIFASPDALVSVLTGLMLMVLAVVALPALMRFVTPLVSSVAGGAAGGAAMAGAMAALPTGAAQLGQLISGHGSNAASSTSSAQPSGSSQTSGGQAPSAANDSTASGSGSSPNGNGPSGGQGGAGPSSAGGSGSNGSNGSHGANGTGAAASPAGGSTGQAAQAAGQGGGTGVAAGSTAGAAGGASAAGAGAGAGGAAAAGGPVAMAAAAGASKVSEAGQAAAAAARASAQDVTQGDGSQ